MIAYNREWLDALLLKEQAEEWHDEGLLQDAEWKTVQDQHPSPFYSPNIFVRIGLAIFCCILLSAAFGLIAVIATPDSSAGAGIFCLFISVSCFFLLEKWIIGSARHHGSGIDDMLVYTITGNAIGAIWLFMSDSVDAPAAYAFVALPFLIAASIRYADRVTATGAFICGFVFIYSIFTDIQPGLVFIVPFACMAYSAAVYFFTLKERKKYEWRHWDNVLAIVELLAVIAFYAGGNYFMVSETIRSELQIETVPLAWFFWAFTFLVPVAYIYFGLRQKNRILLDLGIAAVAAALATFRYYHAVMPLAWAATLGGAALFIIAYFSIRYLNAHASPGYTYTESGETSFLQEVEQQLIEQTIGSTQPPTAKKDGDFGGGQFGGGGSGGEF